jgi:hypothetical protein
MRRSKVIIALTLLLVLLSGAKAHAQTEERVQLKDGRISFVLPAGFKPMSKEDINFKFGRNGAAYAPEFVYSNERQNVSVAVGVRGGRGLQALRLEDLKKMIEAQLEQSIPGVEWLEREIITRDGRSWIHLHLKAAAIDTGVINDMYMTVFDGQLLVFNFNVTIAQYENYKEILRKSAQTITVK